MNTKDDQEPTYLKVKLSSNDDREIQAIEALVSIMDYFYPNDGRSIPEETRIAMYFHDRFGGQGI